MTNWFNSSTHARWFQDCRPAHLDGPWSLDPSRFSPLQKLGAWCSPTTRGCSPVCEADRLTLALNYSRLLPVLVGSCHLCLGKVGRCGPSPQFPQAAAKSRVPPNLPSPLSGSPSGPCLYSSGHTVSISLQERQMATPCPSSPWRRCSRVSVGPGDPPQAHPVTQHTSLTALPGHPLRLVPYRACSLLVSCVSAYSGLGFCFRCASRKTVVVRGSVLPVWPLGFESQ